MSDVSEKKIWARPAALDGAPVERLRRNPVTMRLWLRWLRRRARKIGQTFWRTQLSLILIAAAIGTICGFASLLFRNMVHWVQILAWGEGGEQFLHIIEPLPWWYLVTVPVVGGFVIGALNQYLLNGGRGAGIAAVIEAAHLKGGRMNFRQGLSSALINSSSLGFGASTGREGPVVHFCCTIVSFLSDVFHVSRKKRLTLFGCAVAGAVASSFNAPIAGVFFALEVVVGHYSMFFFAPVVVSAVAGTLVTRVMIGDFPAFSIPPTEIASFFEFPAFLILGFVSSIVAMIFMKTIMTTEDVVAKFRIPMIIRPAVGGLILGTMALAFPQVLSVGYDVTDAALKAQVQPWLGLEPWVLLLLLIFVKTAATAISLGFGWGGGIFSSALFVGATSGGFFGLVAAQVFPELASSYGIYAIVGMCAVAGAVLGAPISTTLMVFELTQDYSITIALMLATSIASALTVQIMGKSMFTWQLERRGLNVAEGRIRQLLQRQKVRHIMTFDFTLVDSELGLDEVKKILKKAKTGEIFVCNAERQLLGSITFADIRNVAFDEAFESLIKARMVMHKIGTDIFADDTMEHALAQMDQAREEHVPVLQSATDRRVVGMLHYKNVMVAYNKALIEQRHEEHAER